MLKITAKTTKAELLNEVKRLSSENEALRTQLSVAKSEPPKTPYVVRANHAVGGSTVTVKTPQGRWLRLKRKVTKTQASSLAAKVQARLAAGEPLNKELWAIVG